MKFTLSLLAAAALVSAAPQRRQEMSSASEMASSVVASATGSASAAAPSGSQDYAAGLLAALQARGASTLASLVAPLGAQLGPVLQAGEFTILAPSDAALAGVDTSNSTAIQQILMYHVLQGNLPAADIPVNMSLIPATLLQGAPTVQLPNNAAQAVALTKNVFGTTTIIGQNATVLANSTYQNVLIKLIDNVLTVPGPMTQTLSSPTGANASALVSLLGALNATLAGALDSTAGLTVFAPSDDAISAATAALAGVAPEAISQVVSGHVLPQVVYSTNITDGLSAPTLNGADLTLAVNDTGVFVTSNGATAQVIRTDYIAANGVAHVIDRVLYAAPAAASASGAASSAAPEASASASA